MENSVSVKSILLTSAGQITKISEASLKEYLAKMELLAWKMNAFLVERDDILELMGGTEDIAMIKDHYNNHINLWHLYYKHLT